MKQPTCPCNPFSRVSTAILLLALLVNFTMNASAQKVYKFTKEQFEIKGRTALVVGAVLIVGGTVATVAHKEAQSDVNPYGSSGFYNPWVSNIPNRGKQITLNLWPVVVVGGTVVSIIGLDHLIKSKRVMPMVEKQHIPGLDHIGIVYPKLPVIGIKYRL